jgi:hypothetical protein
VAGIVNEEQQRRRVSYLLAKLDGVGEVALARLVWRGSIGHIDPEQMYETEVPLALEALEIAYERWRSIKWQCGR